MIFYFSGTGNTRWAAKELAQATGEQLFFIPEEMKGSCEYTLKEGERIGFVFPTHGWQPPRIVRNFIKRLKIRSAQGHYCYALTGDTQQRFAQSRSSRCHQPLLSCDARKLCLSAVYVYRLTGEGASEDSHCQGAAGNLFRHDCRQEGRRNPHQERTGSLDNEPYRRKLF